MDEANKSLEGAGKTQGPQHTWVSKCWLTRAVADNGSFNQLY